MSDPIGQSLNHINNCLGDKSSNQTLFELTKENGDQLKEIKDLLKEIKELLKGQ